MRRLLSLSLLLFACPLRADDKLPLEVTLADRSTLLLRNWALSYEYTTWRSGGAPATPVRLDTTGIWVGKKELPVAGQTLEILYQPLTRQRDVDGKTIAVQTAQARAIRLGPPDRKPAEFKIEGPPRELLLPTADKKLGVSARSLDLRGETLTGTQRELCLLSYTALVECGDDAANRVTKIKFP